MKMRFVTMGLLIGAWVVTSGCHSPELMQFQSYQPKPLSASTATPPVVLQSPSPYFLRNVKNRDPFRGKPHVVDVCRGKACRTPKVVVKKVAQSRLEQFDLDQLRVTAIVSSTARPAAVVKDPTGWGYVVRAGMAIGKQGGYIRTIRQDGLIIVQTDRNLTGAPRVISVVKLPLQSNVERTNDRGFIRVNGKSYKIDGTGTFRNSIQETRKVH